MHAIIMDMNAEYQHAGSIVAEFLLILLIWYALVRSER